MYSPNPAPPAPQLLLYIATSSEEKYVYNVAGPAGPAKFEAGVAGYEARAFRGCGVVTSSPFEISDDADSLQMLQRNTQVGEFYRMRAPSIDWPDNATENAKHKNYMVRRSPQAASSRACSFSPLACTTPPTAGHHHLQRGVGHARAHCVQGRDRGGVRRRRDAGEDVQEEQGGPDQGERGGRVREDVVRHRAPVHRAPHDVGRPGGRGHRHGRHALRPGRHADLGEHVGQDDRGPLHVRRFCKRFSRWHRPRLRPAHAIPSPSGATPSR